MTKRLSRRDFLKLTAACGCGAALQPGGLGGVYAYAQGVGSGPLGWAHFIYLGGGYDSKYWFQGTDGQFISIRPTLALPNSLLSVGDATVGLHPNLTNLAAMMNSGEAALFRNVNLLNTFDRGHDTKTAKITAGFASGGGAMGTSFLARTVNQPVFAQNGLALMGLGGPDSLTAGTDNGQQFGDLQSGSGTVSDSTEGGGQNDTAHRAIVSSVSRQTSPDGAPGSTQQLLKSALLGRDMTFESLRSALQSIPAGTYTSVQGFGGIFRDLARLSKIPGGYPVMTASGRGGFDSHSGQAGLAATLTEFNTAVQEFKADVGPAIWNRTLVVLISEFGRTARENGSAGTDHGLAFDVPIVGGGLSSGGVKDSGLSGQAYIDLNQNAFNPTWHNFQNVMAAVLLGLTPGLDIQAVFPGINPGEIGAYQAALFA